MNKIVLWNEIYSLRKTSGTIEVEGQDIKLVSGKSSLQGGILLLRRYQHGEYLGGSTIRPMGDNYGVYLGSHPYAKK